MFYSFLNGYIPLCKDCMNFRLAVQLLPLGGTLDIVAVLDFGLNRLATMNICQAVRRCSRIFLASD